MTISGTGYTIYISLLEKEDIYLINNHLSLNTYKNSIFFKRFKEFKKFSFYGFDFNNFFITENFNILNLEYSENLLNINFEKDLFYLISIKEYKGDIFELEKIDNLFFDGLLIELDDIKLKIISNIYKDEDIKLKKGKSTFIGLKQFLIYHKVGIKKVLELN